MNKIKHIGVFTSGGDAPGMNAAIYAVAKAASAHGIKFSGIRRGYEGMIAGDIVPLELHELQKMVGRGGTLLKTARSTPFYKIEGREKASQNLNKHEIDALVAIGGDGTFAGLMAFAKTCSIPAIGIPGTIDNDLSGTDYTLGFDSAVNTAVENIDKIRDTAESHNRVFLIEVMGRDSGYIAIYSGLATGADSILIPESAKDLEQLLEKIRHYHSEDAFIIVVSEGDESGAEPTAAKIREILPDVDLRITKLGHVQRGGSPSAFDRMLGIQLGVAAVEALLEGESHKMAGIIHNEITLTPFEEVIKQHQVPAALLKLMYGL